jgi:hypothetical protein
LTDRSLMVGGAAAVKGVIPADLTELVDAVDFL